MSGGSETQPGRRLAFFYCDALQKHLDEGDAAGTLAAAVKLEPLAKAYEATPVGSDTWMSCDPADSLLDFQLVVATAEAWEVIRHIKILEIREEFSCDTKLISAVRFQRLR
jgi:hypothetical protein